MRTFLLEIFSGSKPREKERGGVCWLRERQSEVKTFFSLFYLIIKPISRETAREKERRRKILGLFFIEPCLNGKAQNLSILTIINIKYNAKTGKNC